MHHPANSPGQGRAGQLLQKCTGMVLPTCAGRHLPFKVWQVHRAEEQGGELSLFKGETGWQQVAEPAPGDQQARLGLEPGQSLSQCLFTLILSESY